MSIFKGRSGAWKTESLFHETNHRSEHDSIYFLHSCHRGTKEKPCLHCKFMEERDPTGRKFAERHLGGWDHFQRLLGFKAFQEDFPNWQEELRQMIKSEAIQRVMELSMSDKESVALAASKYVAEEGWNKTSKGRPSKKQVEAEVKREAKKVSVVDEDYERISNVTKLKVKK